MPCDPSRRRFLKHTGAVGLAVGAASLGRVPMVVAAPAGAPHAEKLGWLLACNAYSFNKLTLFETIGKVAGLGLKYTVGFNWQKLDPKRPTTVFNEDMPAADRSETRKRLSDAGVAMPACYCRKLDDLSACRRLFDFCREMGITMIDGEPPYDAYDMIEKLCNEYQINLAVHNHAKPSPYWLPETALKLFEGRGPRIGACCDTGHWIRSELPTVPALAKFQGRLMTLDLKDLNAEGNSVPYGTGKGDLPGVLRELYRQKFRGLIGIEYGQRSPAGEAEIAQCAAFVERTAQELIASH